MRSNQTVGIIGGIVASVIIIAIVIFVNVPSASDQTQRERIGVSENTDQLESIPSESKIMVVASFYPLYEFTKNMGGKKIDVITLIPIGIEPHDWEPTPVDIQRLSKADIFIYNGLDFEPWVNKIVTAGELTNIIVVETSVDIELIELQEDDHGHVSIDPHIWLDPILAKHQLNKVKEALIKADPINTQYYENNAKTYMTKLDALDAKIRSELANCEKDTFVSFHQAFGYFAKRYSLNEVSLGGLVPQAEASPAQLKELVEFIRANDLKVIYSEELVDPRLAEVLAMEAGAKVLLLSPIEGLSDAETRKGVTYLEKMEQNLQNLKVGLECL